MSVQIGRDLYLQFSGFCPNSVLFFSGSLLSRLDGLSGQELEIRVDELDGVGRLDEVEEARHVEAKVGPWNVQSAQGGDQVSKGIRLEVVDASLDGAEACEWDRLEVVALSDEVVGHFLQQHDQWNFMHAYKLLYTPF